MKTSELVITLKYYIEKNTDFNFFPIGYSNTIYENVRHGRTINDSTSNLSIQFASIACDSDTGLSWHMTQTLFHKKTPEFNVWCRNHKLKEVLSEEYQLLTDEQRYKVELLRLKALLEKNDKRKISKESVIDAYILTFKAGDKVTYKNMPGIITYLHTGGPIKKFTVKTNETYHKYVPGQEITKRIKRDLSHVLIPDDIKNMTTGNLLLELRQSRAMGYDDIELKAELNNRPHIKSKKAYFK
jgi:hypothetical protein